MQFAVKIGSISRLKSTDFDGPWALTCGSSGHFTITKSSMRQVAIPYFSPVISALPLRTFSASIDPSVRQRTRRHLNADWFDKSDQSHPLALAKGFRLDRCTIAPSSIPGGAESRAAPRY